MTAQNTIKNTLTDNNVFRTARSLTSYMGCIAMTLAVTYFLDGTAGMLITAALVSAFVISVTVSLVVMKTIDVTISADKQLLTKGETLDCMIKLTNSLPLPAPVIEIEADCSAHLLISETTLYKGAVEGRSSNIIKMPVTARHSGAAVIRIKRVTLTDYLGIFSFGLKVPEEQLTVRVSVYPDIPEAAVQTDFLKTTATLSNNDDEEEESSETAINPTGIAGYDHRQYFPGDPIKRINWKMSSKRDIYMIRLDEQIRGTGQVFFLDVPMIEENEFTLSVRDNVIEGLLTIFTMLVREGKEAAFYYGSDGLWLSHEIRAQNDIIDLQEILSGFSPSRLNGVIPAEIISAGKTPICFTAAVGDHAGSAEQIAAQIGRAHV